MVLLPIRRIYQFALSVSDYNFFSLVFWWIEENFRKYWGNLRKSKVLYLEPEEDPLRKSSADHCDFLDFPLSPPPPPPPPWGNFGKDIVHFHWGNGWVETRLRKWISIRKKTRIRNVINEAHTHREIFAEPGNHSGDHNWCIHPLLFYYWVIPCFISGE